MPGKLSDHDHELMDQFLAQIFDDVCAQVLEKADFIERIALIVTAVDTGEHAEALRCFKAGLRKHAGGLRIVT